MRETRRLYQQTPEQKLKLAAKHNWLILVLDVPITGRLRRHIIYDAQGHAVQEFKNPDDAFAYMVENGHAKFLLDSINWPRALYVTSKPTQR